MKETKHDKFLRLSKARMEKVEFAMKQLHYLASPNYEFSEDEAKDIINQLLSQVDTISVQLGVQPEPRQTTLERDQQLIKIGPQLGAAVDALEDQKPDQAYQLLLDLLRS